MNHNVNIRYAGYLMWDPCERGPDPQVENCCCKEKGMDSPSWTEWVSASVAEYNAQVRASDKATNSSLGVPLLIGRLDVFSDTGLPRVTWLQLPEGSL